MNGETPTDFIDKHYPDGFSGVELSVKQCTEIAAIAAKASFWRGDVLQRPPNSLYFVEEGDEEEFQTIVCLGGMFGSPYLVEQAEDVLKVTPHDTDESHSVQVEGVEMGITFPIMDAFVNGEEKTFQISNEDNTGSFSMTYEGATFDVIVMSLKEYELCSHMKEPRKLDTSNKILSPMPGTLISYSVENGEHVIEDQDICIVEAMKMQNVIRAPRSGVIKKLHAKEGSSMMADEIIVEFEKND